ncbi:MAG: hypothetical protein AAF721_09850 [Myxococcota bacterium]
MLALFLAVGVAAPEPHGPVPAGEPPASTTTPEVEPPPAAQPDAEATREPDPADAIPRVAIVAASASDPLVIALQGELGTLGFAADTVVERDAEVTYKDLRAVGQQRAVTAAIWISPDHGEIVIWVDDRGNGRTIIRELPAESESEDVVVLRAVELLRASLRELQSTDAPSESDGPDPVEPVPQPRVRAEPKPERPRWLVDLGPGLTAAPGGVGVSASVGASLRFMPHRVIGVRVAALAPTLGPRVEGAEGSARVSIAHVVAGPHVVLVSPKRRLQPDLGLGLGLSVVRVDGQATTPFVGQTDHVVGFAARLGAGLAVVLHPSWALRLDAAAGVTTPTARVAFGARTIARFGQPFGLGVLAVEGRFARRP